VSEAVQVVAIDGPAGTGKSSVARALAKKLGFRFLDTGAMYRAATWRAVHEAIDLNDPEALIQSTRDMDLALEEQDDAFRVFVDGHEVTDAIRTTEITKQIARLDQIPEVREHMVALQREYGEQGPTVAEGRDIGTVVFPKAGCKIFLDASPEVRVQRRAEQLRRKGVTVDVEALRLELAGRDAATRKRKLAPLRQADDAVLLDTSDMTFGEVVDRLSEIAKEKLCP